MGRGRGGSPSHARRGGAAPALSAILTRGLTKRYGDIAAVDSLDLAVEPGTLYGFLGPNGSGKTTTIRMLLGLVFPTAGDAELLGRPMLGSAREAQDALRRVGAIIEEPGFWRYLSGRRNLEYFAKAAGLREDRAARLERVDECLRTVDLAEAATKKVKAYSQGMRQRLAIALALLGSPEVLVLDEPTNGLDPGGMRDIRTLLRRLADGGTTVFVSSHLLAEVEAMCDVVGVLARGKLVAEGPPATLRRAGDRIGLQVDDRKRAIAILAGMDGVTVQEEGGAAGGLRLRLAPPATAAAVNAALVHAGIAVSAIVPEQDTLEDVFVSLVEGADAPR